MAALDADLPGAREAPAIAREPQYDREAPGSLRLLAALVDLAVCAALVTALPQTSHASLYALAVFIGYHTLLVWLLQQTVGKALFGLKVERIVRQPSFFWALGRASLGYCAVDLFGIGLLAALVNSSHRCFHDLVFGSCVLAGPPEKMRLHLLLARLAAYAGRLKKAEEDSMLTKLAVIVDFLCKRVEKLQKALEWMGSKARQAPVKSALRVVSAKTAVAVTVLASALTATAAFYVPPVRSLADRILTPHVSSHPPDGWGVCDCPAQHPYIGVIYRGQRWHPPGYTCPAP